MADDVTVRASNPRDVAAVQRVATAAWHAAYDDILGTETVERALEEWYGDEAIEAGISHDAQDFLVAQRGEEVVGFAHVGPHPPRRVYQLYRLYVHPDEWRRGIGRQLLAAVEQALYERDVQRYEANAISDNEAAIAFYESNGFERVDDSERDMVGETVTEVVLGKRI